MFWAKIENWESFKFKLVNISTKMLYTTSFRFNNTTSSTLYMKAIKYPYSSNCTYLQNDGTQEKNINEIW